MNERLAALPLLPTTPFLLLASGCFVRSSPRLHRWLMRSRLFGPLLQDWQQHRGVRLHVKLTAVTVVVAAVAASIFFGNLPWPLTIVLIVLAIVGLVVVLRLPVIGRTKHVPASTHGTASEPDPRSDVPEC